MISNFKRRNNYNQNILENINNIIIKDENKIEKKSLKKSIDLPLINCTKKGIAKSTNKDTDMKKKKGIETDYDRHE